jgi:hypothetical protein
METVLSPKRRFEIMLHITKPQKSSIIDTDVKAYKKTLFFGLIILFVRNPVVLYYVIIVTYHLRFFTCLFVWFSALLCSLFHYFPVIYPWLYVVFVHYIITYICTVLSNWPCNCWPGKKLVSNCSELSSSSSYFLSFSCTLPEYWGRAVA